MVVGNDVIITITITFVLDKKTPLDLIPEISQVPSAVQSTKRFQGTGQGYNFLFSFSFFIVI